MKQIVYTFRFPIKQLNEHQVEIRRQPGGPGVLNPEFLKLHNMTEEESERMETGAIRAVALEDES